MNYLRLLRIFSVLFALTVCTSYLHATALTPSTTTINLLCTMGQPCASVSSPSVAFNQQVITLSNTGTDSYTIAAPSVPWLTVNPLSATVVNPATPNLTFTVNALGWTTLPAGLNSTTVQIVSATGGNTTITVYLQIQAAAGTLTVKGGLNVLNPYNYVATSPTVAVTMSFTVVSTSGLPVPFTVAASSTETPESVSNWLSVASGSVSGIAYSWGTTISVVASQAAIAAAFPGDYLVGNVTITPNANTANNVTVPVNIFVGAGTPTISSLSPNLVPLLASGVAPGYVTFVIHGSGFVASPAAQKTKVFYGTTAATCNNVILTDYVTWINSNYLQVAVPYGSTGVPFATAGTTALYLGVANGATPAVAAATAAVGVTSAPIISSITSASSFIEAGAGAAKAAPYDVISIFGTNLCPGCTGTNSVLVAVPDPVFYRFPTFVSPDGTHKVTVTFTKAAGANPLPGYLLFATNNQINVTVPGGLTSAYTLIQVGYDVNTPASAANSSVATGLTYAAVDPGVFTIESSGQGQAAALNLNTSTGPGAAGTVIVLNSSTNPAIGGAASAAVALYMTGLGIPDAAGTNAAQSPQGLWTAASNAFNCIAPLGVIGTSALAPTGYMGTVITPYFSAVTGTGFQQISSYVVPSPTWTSIDGAIINSNEFNTNVAAPCFLESDAGAVPGTNPLLTVTLTGVGTASPATLTAANGGITYAGFVSGSIAGLYQINFTVPASVGNGTSATTAAVVVTVGSSTTAVSSQAGVTLYVE